MDKKVNSYLPNLQYISMKTMIIIHKANTRCVLIWLETVSLKS